MEIADFTMRFFQYNTFAGISGIRKERPVPWLCIGARDMVPDDFQGAAN